MSYGAARDPPTHTTKKNNFHTFSVKKICWSHIVLRRHFHRIDTDLTSHCLADFFPESK
jgi:hypothetical protein